MRRRVSVSLDDMLFNRIVACAEKDVRTVPSFIKLCAEAVVFGQLDPNGTAKDWARGLHRVSKEIQSKLESNAVDLLESID